MGSTNKRRVNGSNRKTLKNKKQSIVVLANDKSAGHGVVPKYEIKDNPAFARVIFELSKGQTIYSNAGMMSYMDKSIEVKTETGGFFKGLKRALFTKASLFLTAYTGKENRALICFANHLPGDITGIEVKPGDKYIISSQGVVCMTSNVVFDTKFQFKGLFVGNNMFLAEVSVPITSKEGGIVWMASYGGIQKLHLPAGETLSVAHGMYLCSHADIPYTIGTVGSGTNMILSGQGFIMNFTGPCSIYTQGRDLHEFTRFIRKIAESTQNQNRINY
jgi:uncharacterized protein (TIGR00266 family)